MSDDPNEITIPRRRPIGRDGPIQLLSLAILSMNFQPPRGPTIAPEPRDPFAFSNMQSRSQLKSLRDAKREGRRARKKARRKR